MSKPSVIIFGASGAIGSALCSWFYGQDYEVTAISRKGGLPQNNPARWLQWEGGQSVEIFSDIAQESIDAVVWAQGINFSDDIHTFDLSKHHAMYDANVTYILHSLQALLQKNLLAPSARLCVISSIWQNLAKQNKMSYCITKSALQGLVQSLSIDLGPSGYLVNAVLPGALDTPMTRVNLNEAQLRRLEEMTPLGTL